MVKWSSDQVKQEHLATGSLDHSVTIVGAGLAGCEAAFQCARRGVAVELWEQRPGVSTEAHRTADFAELVCSNSLKSQEPTNAHGLLKAELELLGSELLRIARGECDSRRQGAGR